MDALTEANERGSRADDPAAGSAPASVAVVIVNRNAGDLLRRALGALAEQTVTPRSVIVVDNASTDGSADGLGDLYEGVDVVRLDSNVGFAAGNNVGIRRAERCDWVALLNPDAFPERDWLERLLRAADDHPEFGFLTSRLVNAAEPERLDGTGDIYHVSGVAFRRDHGKRIEDGTTRAGEIFAACAAAAMYRRDALLDVGCFDESFFCYYEDVDLAFRLRLAGHRCLYVPGSVVHHVGSAVTGRESDFSVYHAQRNLVWTYVKDVPAPLLVYLPQHLLVNVLAVVWYAMRGQGRVVLAAKGAALRGLPRALASRRSVQRRRAASARELRRVMAKGLVGYTTALGRARRSVRAGDAAAAEPRRL